MIVAEQGSVFLSSLQAFWAGIISWVPGVLLAIILFIVGVVIASLIGHAVAHLINLAKIDRLFDNTGFKAAINRAGYELRIGAFIGWLVKWFFILGFLIAVLDLLNLQTAAIFLQNIVIFSLPRIIVAVLVLIFGSVLADFVGKLVSGSARVANLTSSNMAGSVARWAIWIITILFALNELGIGAELVQAVWWGIVIMLALAFGLAFGLGGREHASRALDRIQNSLSHRQ